MPMLLLGAICLPAFIIVVIATVTNDDELPGDYTSYVLNVSLLVMVYVAGQAPANVSRDLRFRVVSLYFSRPLERIDYVVAKYAAMTAAIFVLHGPAAHDPVRRRAAGEAAARTSRCPTTCGRWSALCSWRWCSPGSAWSSPRSPRAAVSAWPPSSRCCAVLAGVQGAVQAIAVEEGADTFAGYAGLFSPFTLVQGVMSSVLGARRGAAMRSHPVRSAALCSSLPPCWSSRPASAP